MIHLRTVAESRPTTRITPRIAPRIAHRIATGIIGVALMLSGCTIIAATPDDPVKPEAVSIKNLGIAESLIGQAGDAAAGKKIFANRKQGNCLACHVNSDLKDQLFHGGVGPSLDGVAARWSESQLRTIVVNAKAVFTQETVMPGFYSLDVGADVRKDLIGKTILTAQQVEDVVAYLVTLK